MKHLKKNNYELTKEFLLKILEYANADKSYSLCKLARDMKVDYNGVMPIALKNKQLVRAKDHVNKYAVWVASYTAAEITISFIINIYKECSKIIASYGERQKAKKISAKVLSSKTLIDKKPLPVKKCELAMFNDNTLLTELKSRGYQGTLSKAVTITL